MSAGYLWIDNAFVAEGNSGTKVVTFTVRRTGGSEAFAVKYATEDGVALAADGDYVATSGVLRFRAGVESQTVSVTVRGDTKVELDEYFWLRLSDATNGAVLPVNAGAIGLITNDEKASGAGNVWIGDSSVVEGNGGTRLMTFVVERSGGTKAFSVKYATASNYGDATEGVDYVKTSGVLSFAAGETRKTFTVEIKGDTVAERLENLGVILSEATGGAVLNGSGGLYTQGSSGPNAVAWGTILDEDTGGRGVISISAPVSVVEGDAGTKTITFTVTRSGGTGAFSVDYATYATDNDFTGGSGRLNFAAGVNSRTITLQVNGDTAAEADEMFGVNLYNATNGAVIRHGSSGFTIVNDDGGASSAAGQVWINDATVTEGNEGTRLVTFTISRSNGVLPFSVNYQTADGGGFGSSIDPATGIATTAATAGQDYTPIAGVLQFGAGVMSRTVTVAVLGDALAEGAESFLLRLSNPTNGAVIMGTAMYGRDFGTGIILDDDGTIPSTPGRVRIDNAVIVEGANGTRLATFNVTRSGGSGAFSIDYDTADNGASVVEGDYQAASGTLQFAGGVTSQTVTVAINGDSAVEYDEAFAVVLSNATNGAIVDKSIGHGRILNDDFEGFTGVVSIGNPAYGGYATQEGNSGTRTLTFTVTRTAGTGAFSVKYATVDGTATAADQDYVAATGTLNFADGVDTQTISIVVKGDTRPEPDQSFYVRLFEPTNGALLGTAIYTGIIVNDEPTVLVDTGARLAAMSASKLSALAGQGIRQIDASDDVLTLKAAQWAALQGDPASYLDDVRVTLADDVTLKDTGANLASLSISALASLWNNVDRVDVSDRTVALTMTQAVNLRAPLAVGDVVTVRDTGQSIAIWSAASFADLAARFAGSFDATDDALVLRVDQYRSLGGRTLTGADVVTLRDSEAALDSLTKAELAQLAKKGVDLISSTSSTLTLTAERYKALGSVGVDPSNLARVVDTGAVLTGLKTSLMGELAARGIDGIDATNDLLTLSPAQLSALGTVALSQADFVTLKGTATALASLSPGALGALAGKGVDMLDATGGSLALSLEQYAALGSVTVSTGDALKVAGTALADTIVFGNRRLGANDRVAGGAGTDTLMLDGDYSAGLVLKAATIDGVEVLSVASGNDYSLRTADENVAAGGTLNVSAAALGALDSLVFDGSAETNGRFAFLGGAGDSTVTGGRGADSFTGGSGRETIRYTSAAQSSGAAYDTVVGFDAAIDRFDTWTSVAAVDTPIVTGKLSAASFDTNLATAMAGLASQHAAMFTADTGTLAGATFLVVDTNGLAGYQSGGDLVVRLQNSSNLGAMGTSTFV